MMMVSNNASEEDMPGELSNSKNHAAAGKSKVDAVLRAHHQWEGQLENATPLLVLVSLIRATKLVNERIANLLRSHGLTLVRFSVLARLYWSAPDGLLMSEVADFLLVNPTSMTSAIDRLERDGLVQRTKHPGDRRAILLLITNDGQVLFKDLSVIMTAANWGLGDLGIAESQELAMALRILRRRVGDRVGENSEYRNVLGDQVSTSDASQ